MKTILKIGEKSYKVEILEIEKNLIKVVVDSKEYFLTQNEKGELSFLDKDKIFSVLQKDKKEDNFYHLGNEKIIKAPLAGVVSKIFVKKGEIVKRNDLVAVLSAMKMENEIIAESYGKIKEIKFKEGQQIKKDDILILLE